MTAPDAKGPSAPDDADAHFWQEQSDRLERDARHLKLVPLVCLAGALLLAFAGAPPAAALALVLLGLTVAAMAAYMVTVRRQECRQGLAEARRRCEPRAPPAADAAPQSTPKRKEVS